jgi:hypothetical protein
MQDETETTETIEGAPHEVPASFEKKHGPRLVAHLGVDCAQIVIVERAPGDGRWITIAGDACTSCLRMAAAWCKRPMKLLGPKIRNGAMLSVAMTGTGCVRTHCHAQLALSKEGVWYVCPDLGVRGRSGDVEYICVACAKELHAWTHAPLSGVIFLTDDRVAQLEVERQASMPQGETGKAARPRAPRSRRGGRRAT